MLKAMHYRRLATMTTLLTFGFLFHVARLFYLQVLRHDDLGAITWQYDRYWQAPDPWRGEIRARNGEPLAVTFPVKTVYADLTVCAHRLDDCARIMAESLGLNADEIRNRFRAACSSTAGGATLQALRLKTGGPECR
jgi:cell division protein FtsI/penicillin-binding protein 2